MKKNKKANNYVEDKNWAAKNIPESIKSIMLELQVMHDEIEAKQPKSWKKLLPAQLFKDKNKEDALNDRFKTEVVPVLLEQHFQSVNYYQDQSVAIDHSSAIPKYFRCTGRIKNPDLITGYKNGIPFNAGQIEIRTSSVENSQTGSSGTEVAFSGILIILQNKFSVEKPVTIALKAQKVGIIKSLMRKIKDAGHKGSDLELEFNKKFHVITKNTDTHFLTNEMMIKLLDIRLNANYGSTIFFEEDKLYITKTRFYGDNFGFSFYLPQTLENKFNRVNDTIIMMSEIIESYSVLLQ